jgi:hypothetical protein
MRQIKFLFFSLAMLLLATSCSNVDDRTEGLIPSDAVMVLKADMPQLIKHSGVDIKDGKIVLPTKFRKMLKEMGDSKDINKNLDKLVNSGIDFKHSSYVFVPDGAINGKSEFEVVVLVPVDDVDKVKNYIEDETDVVLEKKGDMMIGHGESGDYFLIKDGTMCYTSVWKEDVEDEFVELLSPESSISSNKAVAKALDTSDDINIFMDSKKIRKTATKEIGNDRDPAAMAAASAMDIIDTESTAIHINFADNECNIRTENEFPENSDYLKLVKKMTAAPNADLVPMMPSGDHTMIYSVSINGAAIANFNLVKKLLGDAYDDPDFAKILDIFKSIKGPVVFGLACNDLQTKEFDAVVATKTPKASNLHGIIGMTPFAEEAQRHGGEYVISASYGGPSFVLGEDDDVLYFKYLSSGKKTSAKDKEIKSLFSESLAAVYCTSRIDDMKMQFTASSKDLASGSAKLWVMEDGKKLCLLDALTFFVKFSDAFNTYSYSDYDYEYEPDYSELDTVTEAVVAEEPAR